MMTPDQIHAATVQHILVQAGTLERRARALAESASYSDDARTYQAETSESSWLAGQASILRTAASILVDLADPASVATQQEAGQCC